MKQDEPIETTAVAVRHASPVGQALGVSEIVAQVALIQDVMHRVMKENEHYGQIPGCGTKKTLLQPGAQKLTMTFRLAPEYQIEQEDLGRGHVKYRVICTLSTIQGHQFVGQGVGSCSTMEGKYRWRGGARKCPECGKETIIMGKKFRPTDPDPGWLCWVKRGGCGATWPKGAQEIEAQSVEKVENDSPADFDNTVLKMAKKRAYVDATITALAASDIFTQDVGDPEGDAEPPTDAQTPQEPPKAAQGSPSKRTVQPKAPAKPAPEPKKPKSVPKSATVAQRDKMLAGLFCREGEAGHGLVLEYAQKAGILLDTEKITDWPLRYVPTTLKQYEALVSAISDFEAGRDAVKAFNNDEPGPEPAPSPAKDRPQTPKPPATDPPKAAKPSVPAQQATEPELPGASEEAWRSFVMPMGKNKGKTLGELDKKYLFGLWANFDVRDTDDAGRPRKEEWIAADQALRAALDEAGVHYKFEE